MMLLSSELGVDVVKKADKACCAQTPMNVRAWVALNDCCLVARHDTNLSAIFKSACNSLVKGSQGVRYAPTLHLRVLLLPLLQVPLGSVNVKRHVDPA